MAKPWDSGICRHVVQLPEEFRWGSPRRPQLCHNFRKLQHMAQRKRQGQRSNCSGESNRRGSWTCTEFHGCLGDLTQTYKLKEKVFRWKEWRLGTRSESVKVSSFETDFFIFADLYEAFWIFFSPNDPKERELDSVKCQSESPSSSSSGSPSHESSGSLDLGAVGEIWMAFWFPYFKYF